LYVVEACNGSPETYPSWTKNLFKLPSIPKTDEPDPELPTVTVPEPIIVVAVKPVYTSTLYELLPEATKILLNWGVIDWDIASDVGADKPVRFTVPVPDTTTLPPTSSIEIYKAI
jgi:hypothetical protein